MTVINRTKWFKSRTGKVFTRGPGNASGTYCKTT